MLKDLIIRETSRTIKCMVKEFSTINRISQLMKDSGTRISSMGKEYCTANVRMNLKRCLIIPILIRSKTSGSNTKVTFF
jgi:hypothetical protein